MSYFDENENRIIYGAQRARPARLKHTPGMARVWEKRAQEMREKIKSGQDPREEVKK